MSGQIPPRFTFPKIVAAVPHAWQSPCDRAREARPRDRSPRRCPCSCGELRRIRFVRLPDRRKRLPGPPTSSLRREGSWGDDPKVGEGGEGALRVSRRGPGCHCPPLSAPFSNRPSVFWNSTSRFSPMAVSAQRRGFFLRRSAPSPVLVRARPGPPPLSPIPENPRRGHRRFLSPVAGVANLRGRRDFLPRRPTGRVSWA